MAKVKLYQRGGFKKSHDQLLDFTHRAGLSLMSARRWNGLTIKLQFRTTDLGSAWAKCLIKTNGSKLQKEFTIFVDKRLPTRFQKKCILHELVHVNQVVSGRYQIRWWKSDDQLHVRWNKKDYGLLKEVEYFDMPWEIEAHELEKNWKEV